MGTTNAASHRETAEHRSDNDRKERGQTESQIAGQQSHLGQIQTERCDFAPAAATLSFAASFGFGIGGGDIWAQGRGIVQPFRRNYVSGRRQKGDKIEVEYLTCKGNECKNTWV